MDIGIGLPNMVPGASGARVVEWAQRSEARGFSSLGTLDRDPLRELRAADRARRRGGGDRADRPPHRGPARAAAHQRAAAGQAGPVGPGALRRPPHARDRARRSRGRLRGERGRARRARAPVRRAAHRSDRGLEAGRASVPRPRRRRGLVVGGQVDKSFERVARFGDGWIQGRPGAEQFAELAPKARAAWTRPAASGEPRTAGDRLLLARRARRGGGAGAISATTTPGSARKWLSSSSPRAATDADTVRNVHRGLPGGRLRRADLLPLQLRSRPGRPAGRGRRPLS